MKLIKHSWHDVQAACIDIARQMHKDNWIPDYIVGITRGGAVPAILLSQYFDLPMQPLAVNLRDHRGCVSNIEFAENAIGYVSDDERAANGGHRRLDSFMKKILVVDDINDTGATLNWIREDWEESCLLDHERWSSVWHENVRTAVLVEHVNSSVATDYYMWTIDKIQDDVWIEFPWENFWVK